MHSPIFSILLICNLAVPIFGVSCYRFSARSSQNETVHHKSYCTAIYEVANGLGSFSGADHDPLKMEKLHWDFNQGKDCQLRKYRVHSVEWQVMYYCLCFTSMCNFPFSYKEFEQRGFTLAPKFAKDTSLW